MGLEACAGLLPGIPVLSCLSSEANFFPGIMVLIVFFGIVFFGLNKEPASNRFAASTFSTSIIALLLSLMGMIPNNLWGLFAVLSIGAAAILALNK